MGFSTFLYGQSREEVVDTSSASEEEGVYIKDISRISGIRSNQVFGYGLVVGLASTGDSRSKLAVEFIQGLLSNLGEDLSKEQIGRTRNIAAVFVTAEIDPLRKIGDKVPATVSSMGDARSLDGGILMQTPLYGADNEIYAVAQGSITTGNKKSSSRREGSRRSRQKTVGSILDGVFIEKNIPFPLLENSSNRELELSLNDFNFNTLERMHSKIKSKFPQLEIALNGGKLNIKIPSNGENMVQVIAKIGELRIKPSYPAKVIINERTGTVVMGGDIRIAKVLVSRFFSNSNGGEQNLALQEDALSGINITDPSLKENSNFPFAKNRNMVHMIEGKNIEEILKSFNSIGASVEDVISLLEALREIGALHAELIIR